jgi:hypothetical protein
MGIDVYGAPFLMYCKQQGVDFTRSCTLGRQHMNIRPEDLAQSLKEYGYPDPVETAHRLVPPGGSFADEFLKLLGAETVSAIDNSDYEGAIWVHDMNEPTRFKQMFTTVLDGGTLEHIYNFPQAIKNAKGLVKIGGHYIGMSPSNQTSGHGFYQFSPELYFRVFGEGSGFKLKKLAKFQYGRGEWINVEDPGVTGHLVNHVSDDMLYLLIIAQKEAEVDQPYPNQANWVKAWDWAESQK